MSLRLGAAVLAATLLAGGAAQAAPMTMGGEPALAFAALVGHYSPGLTAAQKHILFRFLGGQTAFASSNATITFQVDEVQCRQGHVELQEHSCRITYGGAVTTLGGEEGAGILAEMIVAGVPGQGAAGSMYVDAQMITCTLDVAELKSPDGGGASCTYTP